ncbi:MAG TPA: YIP1 family protein [Candidatus Baltobacteraceae bacterium]|nr:YIP1 family protein [Candidatus Baltobacteraceae bacterium]
MQVSDEPAQGEKPRAGFALPLDILIAPQRAFRTIAATREWLPAALVIVVLAAIGTALIAPAVAHVAKAQLIANQHGHPSDKELAGAARTDIVLTFLSGTVLQVFPLTLTAMVLSTAGRLKGQTTPFLTYFALNVNCAVPAALGAVLQSLFIRAHDPASYVNNAQLALAVPLSLAAFVPHGSQREVLFMAQFDVFFLWTALLIAYGYMAISGAKLLSALFLSFGIGFALCVYYLAVTPG